MGWIMVAVMAIIGVLGIGMGLWWVDGIAALFISAGILRDGLRNTKFAVLDLMDESAITYDQRKNHPLIKELQDYLIQVPWIASVGIRTRDLGHVFHVEVFVEATADSVSTEALIDLTMETISLNWKLQDVVIIPVQDIPPNTHARYSHRRAEQ